MKLLFKVLHLLSLSVFIGSIATYIFLGTLIPSDFVVAMELNRAWVAKSTLYLTIFSMWATGLTGLLLSGKPKKLWLWGKLFGFVGIAVNTHLFIYPAIVESKASFGNNSEVFQNAMQQEAIFGAVNIIIIIILVSLAVIKPKFGKDNNL